MHKEFAFVKPKTCSAVSPFPTSKSERVVIEQMEQWFFFFFIDQANSVLSNPSIASLYIGEKFLFHNKLDEYPTTFHRFDFPDPLKCDVVLQVTWNEVIGSTKR